MRFKSFKRAVWVGLALVTMSQNAFSEPAYFSGYEVNKERLYDKLKNVWLNYIGAADADAINRNLACFIKFPENGMITLGFQNTGKMPLMRNPFNPNSGMSLRFTSLDDSVYEMRFNLPTTDPNHVKDMIINPSDYRETTWAITDVAIQDIVSRGKIKQIVVSPLNAADSHWYYLTKSASE